MQIKTVPTTPIEGQKPGTSGLRKKVAEFSAPGFLENYVQAIFDAWGAAGKVLVLGGDGRFFNRAAMATVLRMAAANGVTRVIAGRGGLLSTPAASHLIRLRGADGGLILSASHNPGGPKGDFGLKLNVSNGGPAPEAVTDAIHAETGRISRYLTVADTPPELDTLGETRFGDMVVEVVDPVADYAALMEELFDFNARYAPCSQAASPCASTRCTLLPAPMRMRSSSAAWAPPPAAWSMAPRPKTSAVAIPTRTRSGRMCCMTR